MIQLTISSYTAGFTNACYSSSKSVLQVTACSCQCSDNCMHIAIAIYGIQLAVQQIVLTTLIDLLAIQLLNQEVIQIQVINSLRFTKLANYVNGLIHFKSCHLVLKQAKDFNQAVTLTSFEHIKKQAIRLQLASYIPIATPDYYKHAYMNRFKMGEMLATIAGWDGQAQLAIAIQLIQ